MISTSTDGNTWVYGENISAKNLEYTICSHILRAEKVSLYMCVYEDGVFNIYKTQSSNGISFSGSTL